MNEDIKTLHAQVQVAVDKLAGAIANLEADHLACATMVEAMIISHPDPSELREVWTQLLAAHTALNNLDLLLRPDQTPAQQAHMSRFAAWGRKLDAGQSDETDLLD